MADFSTVSAIDALVERLAREAHAEIRQMAEWARIATQNRFKFLNRSSGQRRRYARARIYEENGK